MPVHNAEIAERFEDIADLRVRRRGGLEAADVLNTRPLAELRALLAPTMKG